MKAAIVSVGTELLFGQIVNTNAAEISSDLNRLGIDVLYHLTVGDNPDRLFDILETALARCDLIVTTGGLGPTQDDLTKETVAKVMGAPMSVHQEAMDHLMQYFSRLDRAMTENNLKQALLPEGASVFMNTQGTAPGFALEKNKKIIACLPGPPREMRAMFTHSLEPFLIKYGIGTIHYRILRTYGLGESAMETALIDLISSQTDPTIATYAGEGECYLRIASKAPSKEEADMRIDQVVELVMERIGEYVYSTDGRMLHEVVAGILMERGLTLSCAESCTGGLFASKLTSVPGISAVFDRGYVTYSNESKIQELGVRKETLDLYGAVSKETAREMAEGLYKRTGSDICISVTGIAGPGGGTPEKPVGMAFIGVQSKDRCTGKTYSFVKMKQARGTRTHINTILVKEILFQIYQCLKS